MTGDVSNTRVIRPALNSQTYARFLMTVQRIAEAVRECGGKVPLPKLVEQFRTQIRELGDQPSIDDLKLMVALSLVVDFIAQGWAVHSVEGQVTVVQLPPGPVEDAKQRIRRSHLMERDAQLAEPAVAEFIRGMERRRLTKKGWHSIHSVLRDGQDLASRLAPIAEITNLEERLAALRPVISPYLQFADTGQECDQTGLLLSDIWRYFRHTWVNVYRSVPGRSMMMLIRDAAAPNHPVIGIAALGSAVVQQTVRDSWIGWIPEEAVELIANIPTRSTVTWLRQQVSDLLDGLYLRDVKADIAKNRRLRSVRFSHPSEELIEYLREESEVALNRHRLAPQKSLHKSPAIQDTDEVTDWGERAKSHLFKGKRCNTLATLLSIRRTLNEHFPPKLKARADLEAAFRHTSVRTAVAQLVRFLKAERVGINMMDITVCGAVPPYNDLLGGKLVCLLLCSPEVVRHYAKRYGNQPSVIASCMKGAPVLRQPQLVLLCTTSLYGSGSSQYNRVKVPTEVLGGKPGMVLQYEEIGHSKGYGVFHFSRDTISALNVLLGRLNHARRVNSIFGEGVNPLMRKIRDGLDVLGLQSDLILNHGNRRIVYGVPLAENFRQVLLGLEQQPRYLVPQSQPAEVTARIAEHWRRRWLMNRVAVPGILERVAQHSLVYPIKHGGLVRLPQAESDELGLW